MKIVYIFLMATALLCIFSFANAENLLIDDFEGVLSAGADGTVDFGSGNGSSLEVKAAQDIKYMGNQSLQAVYNALSGGYMWIARGFGLDAKNSSWLVKPQDIEWNKYNAISFYVYGSDSKSRIAFDIKDNGNEIWRFLLKDDFKGWKKITCLFSDFFARGDWQPDSSDKNADLDFPLKSYQFEPLPEAKGVLYFDNVELVKG